MFTLLNLSEICRQSNIHQCNNCQNDFVCFVMNCNSEDCLICETCYEIRFEEYQEQQKQDWLKTENENQRIRESGGQPYEDFIDGVMEAFHGRTCVNRRS